MEKNRLLVFVSEKNYDFQKMIVLKRIRAFSHILEGYDFVAIALF